MLHRLCRILLTVTMALFAQASFASLQQSMLDIKSIDYSQRLAQGIEYLEDTNGQMTIEEVVTRSGDFQAFGENTLQMGYSDSAYWIRLRITNQLPTHLTESQDDRFYISIRYPLLDDVQFYQINNGEQSLYKTGDRYKFDHRFLKLNNFIYPITIATNETTEVYIRVQSSSSISIPLFVQTEKSFAEQQHKLNTINGIYLGITFGLCVYNLFLWIGVRKKVYGLYVLVILNLMLFNSTMLGYSFRLWPNAVSFQQISIYVFSVTAAAAVCIFGMAFLKTRKFQPKMHKVILGVVAVYAVCVPLMFFTTPLVASKINVLVMLSGVFVLFVAAIRSVIQGYGPARYYLIGQGAVLFSVFFTVLTSQGVIPLYYLAPEVMKWSSAFELIFFSIGLADLVNHERKLREQAQKESAVAQEQLLQSQIKLTQHLDELVRQRTEELEFANQRLQELNTKDELTGLRNRRYLNEAFPIEYQRAYREKSHLSVLLFDIDFFKKLNDTYGHQFGDLCLSTAGKLIQTNLHRPPDVGIRYGGEEFVVMLPNTNMEGAIAVAEKIRKAFVNEVIADDQNSVTITVSIGIASEIPPDREGHEKMLKLADDRLYMAKENGRNQVVATDKIEPKSTLENNQPPPESDMDAPGSQAAG
ncbi:MAG: sensor domain-containing diguanylate cyclase [Pseudomonadales bacterium]|nr:sensor domain-containing diguanylate cyclase [Pseudomonadales bacterium]